MPTPLRRWTLPSDSNSNLRDLGGYLCNGGHRGITKYGALLRSDQIYNLTDEDKQFLLSRNITDIIDLRGSGERESFPNAFEKHNAVTVHSFEDGSEHAMYESVAKMKNMGEFYIWMIDAVASRCVKSLEIIANAQGMTIMHCLVGKDRTGLLAAVLLLALGVDERDVIADYQVSATFLTAFAFQDLLNRPGMPEFVGLSSAENMAATIEYMNAEYGGALAYLKQHGLSDGTYTKLCAKLIEKL